MRITRKYIFLGFILVFAFALNFSLYKSGNVNAAYYDYRENFLGFGVDAVRAVRPTQDSVKITAGIFDPAFLNTRGHYVLPARSTDFYDTSGYSNTEFFDSLEVRAQYYQGVTAQKGAFAFGESQNFNLSSTTNFSEYNGVYFNNTSYIKEVKGLGLDGCTSNPYLYSSNLRDSFITNLNNLPESYSTDKYYQFVNFFQTYGTHVICKAYYGGRIDVHKTVTSHKINFDNSVQTELNDYFDGRYTKAISGEVRQDYSIENVLGWSTNDFEETTRIYVTGGPDLKVYNSLDILVNKVQDWEDGITYDNGDLVDFGEGSLFPIYELIKPLNSKKSSAMKAAYFEYLDVNYDTALETLRTSIPYRSNLVKVYDGTPRKITDDGRWVSPHENVYFLNDLNIDVQGLRDLGYTKFDIILKINMREQDPGYQHIHIYDRSDEDGTAILLDQHENFAYYGSVLWPFYSTVTFEFQDIPVSKLTNNYFTIRARASGNNGDDWFYNVLSVQVEFTKQ